MLASRPLLAQTVVTYVGPAGDIWRNPMNWMPQVIPDNDTNAMNPVFYTVSIDRPVTIDGFLFDIAGMTSSGDVTTKTSLDFPPGSAAARRFFKTRETSTSRPTAPTRSGRTA